MKRIWAAVLMIGLAAMGCGAKEAGTPVPAGFRKPAADFNVKTLDGGSLKLSSLKGKVVLLDFWATWCPPCQEEIPYFKELYSQYKDKGLEIIGLSIDQDGEAAVRPFAKKNVVNYPLSIADQTLTVAYGGIRGIPTTFLIDKQGRIAQKYEGKREKEVFEKEIQALLAE